MFFTADRRELRQAVLALRKMSQTLYYSFWDGVCWISQHHNQVVLELAPGDTSTQCALGVPAVIGQPRGAGGKPLGVKLHDLHRALGALYCDEVSFAVIARPGCPDVLLISDMGGDVTCGIADPVYFRPSRFDPDGWLPVGLVNVRKLAESLRLVNPFYGYGLFNEPGLHGICLSGGEQGRVQVEALSDWGYRRIEWEDEALWFAIDGDTIHLDWRAPAIMQRALPWLGRRVQPRLHAHGCAWFVGEAADLRLPKTDQHGQYPDCDKIFKAARESEQLLTVKAGEFRNVLKRARHVLGFGRVELDLQCGVFSGEDKQRSFSCSFDGASKADIETVEFRLHHLELAFNAFDSDETVVFQFTGRYSPCRIHGSRSLGMETFLFMRTPPCRDDGTVYGPPHVELDMVPF